MIPSPDITGLSDQELTEALATEVLGWRMDSYNHSGDMHWYEGEEPTTESLPICRIDEWMPLLDSNHAQEVTERLDYFTLSKERNADGTVFYNAIAQVQGRTATVIRQPSANRALCLAALKAFRSLS